MSELLHLLYTINESLYSISGWFFWNLQALVDLATAFAFPGLDPQGSPAAALTFVNLLRCRTPAAERGAKGY